MDSHRATPQPGDLGEDEPHPVRLFLPLFQLAECLGETGLLSAEKTIQMIGVRECHDLGLGQFDDECGGVVAPRIIHGFFDHGHRVESTCRGVLSRKLFNAAVP